MRPRPPLSLCRCRAHAPPCAPPLAGVAAAEAAARRLAGRGEARPRLAAVQPGRYARGAGRPVCADWPCTGRDRVAARGRRPRRAQARAVQVWIVHTWDVEGVGRRSRAVEVVEWAVRAEDGHTCAGHLCLYAQAARSGGIFTHW